MCNSNKFMGNFIYRSAHNFDKTHQRAKKILISPYFECILRIRQRKNTRVSFVGDDFAPNEMSIAPRVSRGPRVYVNCSCFVRNKYCRCKKDVKRSKYLFR